MIKKTINFMLRRKRPSGFYQPIYLRHDDLCTTEQVKAILEVIMETSDDAFIDLTSELDELRRGHVFSIRKSDMHITEVMNCVATIHFPIDAFTKLYTNHKWYFHNLGDASEETSVKIFTILKGK